MKKRIIILLLFFCLLAGCTPQTKNEFLPETYPDNYNPQKGLASSPSMTLILTVYANGTKSFFLPVDQLS